MIKRMMLACIAVTVVAGLATGLWMTTREAVVSPTPPATETRSDMSKAKDTMEMPMDMPMSSHRSSEGPGLAMTPGTGANTMMISPERLQSIGVKFQEAARRRLDKVVRTVGRVEIDERLVGRVNLKFEGWIEELHVSAIGDHVKKGQQLFTIYSPDLVATQEEYLLALQSYREMGKSEFPEVARGAKDLLDATRRRLQLWDIKENHIHNLEQTSTVLRTLPIHSPISGTVMRMEARAGTFVTPGTELYFIADLSRIWVVADIYEYELPFIKVGQGATVTLSYDPTTKLHGHVAFIYPTLDAKTRTARVRFELDNPGEKLKPDMYANVELTIPLGIRLVVPRDAVLESGERQLLFIHHGGGQLEWRSITLGAKTGDWVEVKEGLKEGEHVVTGANFLIDSESQLKAAVGGMAGMPGMK
ncbi:MAG: efflux RND transporter periplasmic adaptor subunit [Nitrospira sp.]|nr:efflux RND transporter periplasmic adaptor subunit [Nitrospira sp.]